MSGALHRDAVFIDGLEIARWSRDVFEAMHAGGLTAVNCTCSVWEGFIETMGHVARWKAWLDEHADLIRPVHTTADIAAAKREERVGIILGFQNLSAIEDRIEYLRLFKDLGVRVAQIAYNTQNLVGAGCYESVDRGLSDYGRDVLAEMNRLGILADLSHVGPRTSREVIEASAKPVVYSHTCPTALRPHPRNKTDEELRFIADRGGLVGVTLLPWFLRAEGEATIDDYLDAIDHTVNVAGEESVGIGTDFIQGHGPSFLEWLRRDKGRGRLVTGAPSPAAEDIAMPRGLERIEDLPHLTEAMERRGWTEDRIRKILGLNWLRILADVWGA